MRASPNPKNHLELTLQSHYSELERAVEMVSDFMVECTDDEDLTHRVVLAISEAVSNGMKHGNRGEMERKVHVVLEAFQDRIIASIKDEGDGFNPADIEDPMKEENLFKESGRGLHIMKQVSDKVWFKDGGRVINMRFAGEMRFEDS